MTKRPIEETPAHSRKCDLVPNVLAGVEHVDLSVTVLSHKLAMPFCCSPTALQRLFHHQGELAVAHAVEKFGTMFGVSSLGTVSLEAIASNFSFPQVYQFYFHKDRGLNKSMLERAIRERHILCALPVLRCSEGSQQSVEMGRAPRPRS